MASFNQYTRRSLLPLLALGIACYYLLVLVPLSRRAADLDSPLARDWKALCTALGRTGVRAIDFQAITNQLADTRASLAMLAEARQRAAARLQLAPSVQARMETPFQLVEFQNERSKELDDLARLAKHQNVTVDPAVYAGFPEHTIEIRQPELLWAALSMIDSLLKTGLQCKLTAIQSLDAPLGLTNAPPAGTAPSLVELPLDLEFTGSAESVARFLQSLPLRADEIRAAGLPEAPADKPALFIQRLVLKKESPEKPDDLRVFLRVAGFVMRS